MSRFSKHKKEIIAGKRKLQVLKNIVLLFIGAIALISLIFFHLRQVNSAASLVYELQELESEKSGIEGKNETLKLEITKLRSMDKLQKRIAALNLVKAEEVIYIEEKDVFVAAR